MGKLGFVQSLFTCSLFNQKILQVFCIFFLLQYCQIQQEIMINLPMFLVDGFFLKKFRLIILLQIKMEFSATAILRKASLHLLKDGPLSIVPGDENEIELDQGSITTIKVILPSPHYYMCICDCFLIPVEHRQDFVNGHHGYTCGVNFKTSILAELSGSKHHFHESAQIGSVTSMNFMPKFDGKFQP
jgi:hypothetical protein